MSDDQSWNPLVPNDNIIPRKKYSIRNPENKTPTHIVIHITGTTNFNDVIKAYTENDSVISPHYLIHNNGERYQFIPERYKAPHAGIDISTREIYNREGKQWQSFLKYFKWYKGYPGGTLFLDKNLNICNEVTNILFASNPDLTPWQHYYYFNNRWSNVKPVNFENDMDPNNYSIGIETLCEGSSVQDPSVYTDAMYISLKTLVQDLCSRYGIPNKKGFVVGHEDVNPIGRFGWDPGQGFDWSRIHD